MFFVRSARNVVRRSPLCFPSYRRGFISDADVDKARIYCMSQLKSGDYDAHLVQLVLPSAVRDIYLALRTLNLELARLPEAVTNPVIGHMRMQFWHSAVKNIFNGEPPREPVSILIYASLAALAARTSAVSGASPATGAGSQWTSLKLWLLRFISTRERHMDNHPFPTMAALEEYAESTYATLMYITLAMLPLRSIHVDHLASHIGKACGIVAILRGVPVLAAPSTAAQSHSSGSRSEPVLLLPLDVMAEARLKEEDVYRLGPDAPGLQDAVFSVATRANDHLITARQMLKGLRAGQYPDHEYEYVGEMGHTYTNSQDSKGGEDGQDELQALRRGFGVLAEAIPAQDFLSRLESANFDPFRVRRSWKLPWSLYWAQKRQQI